MDTDDQIDFFESIGVFIGKHTFEVDIFCKSGGPDTVEGQIISSVFDDLTAGGHQQKQNFKNNMSEGKYDRCLAQIEASNSQIGKGRFSQRLSSCVTHNMMPEYIEAAIAKITELVRSRSN